MRAAGVATRERILAAALDELMAYGAAGARINRIAQSARASKERLYAYFPSKEALFHEAISKVTVDVSEDAALRADDLPGYAGRLFDVYLTHPGYVRIDDWLNDQLGEVPDAHRTRVAVLQPKVDEIRRGQRAGLVATDLHPADLLNMILQVVRGMVTPSKTIRDLDGGSEGRDDPEDRRQAVVDTVRRLVTP
jgi:AcrR family transcriptional regulator